MAVMQGKTILAISSGGGHWVQLLRLRSAFAGRPVVFASVLSSYGQDVAGERFMKIPDATRWDRMRLVWMVLRILWLLLTLRPEVVVSTGALPGYVAVRLGKLLGARTIWIDSIANVEELSMSGARIGKHADLWLTQWPHLARDGGPSYLGAVL